MIPSTASFFNRDFEIEEQPSLTYKMDLENDSVRGLVDQQEAMKQAIFRILNTERYQYIIYPWWYGTETIDLYGKPTSWVCAELERRVKEALLVDSRIRDVSDFQFDCKAKEIRVTFTVDTVYGKISAGKGVNI